MGLPGLSREGGRKEDRQTDSPTSLSLPSSFLVCCSSANGVLVTRKEKVAIILQALTWCQASAEPFLCVSYLTPQEPQGEGPALPTSQMKSPRHHVQGTRSGYSKARLTSSGLRGQCSPALLPLDSPTLSYYLVPSNGLRTKGKSPRPTSPTPASSPGAVSGMGARSSCPYPGAQ